MAHHKNKRTHQKHQGVWSGCSGPARHTHIHTTHARETLCVLLAGSIAAQSPFSVSMVFRCVFAAAAESAHADTLAAPLCTHNHTQPLERRRTCAHCLLSCSRIFQPHKHRSEERPVGK